VRQARLGNKVPLAPLVLLAHRAIPVVPPVLPDHKAIVATLVHRDRLAALVLQAQGEQLVLLV